MTEIIRRVRIQVVNNRDKPSLCAVARVDIGGYTVSGFQIHSSNTRPHRVVFPGCFHPAGFDEFRAVERAVLDAWLVELGVKPRLYEPAAVAV